MIIFIESHLAAINITGFYSIKPSINKDGDVTVHFEYKDIDGNKDEAKLNFKSGEFNMMRNAIASILTQMKEVDNYVVTTELENAIRKATNG